MEDAPQVLKYACKIPLICCISFCTQAKQPNNQITEQYNKPQYDEFYPQICGYKNIIYSINLPAQKFN